MLIKINDKSRLPILPLWRLIFRFTFDKKTCAYNTKKIIEEQLLKWHSFIQANKKSELEKFGLDPETQFTPVGQKGSILDEFEYQLVMMRQWVRDEEEDKFRHKIETYIRSNTDYRLVKPMAFAFPECSGLRNTDRGLAHLRQAMKDNPQDYEERKKGR